MVRTITVTGMSCEGCEQNIEESLQELDGVIQVSADHESESVEVGTDDDVRENDIHAAIKDAGYQVA
ncbi:heavy-metal-associated domain-containing protein [Natranaeroarchaeum sulfidigenes]|uniref:Copper-ion-binding protein n=1 Tax=Natranaeroarchaeum sulfidigenes TaxID=2784880 RepID=A0A897MPU2_9EURY|nr:cation transporter [Natranaeroarchaeum sulfidigenes]QSG02351.1 Copper-ion-binding protein [Natranaeroarchaeum sulfidigenes]